MNFARDYLSNYMISLLRNFLWLPLLERQWAKFIWVLIKPSRTWLLLFAASTLLSLLSRRKMCSDYPNLGSRGLIIQIRGSLRQGFRGRWTSEWLHPTDHQQAVDAWSTSQDVKGRVYRDPFPTFKGCNSGGSPLGGKSSLQIKTWTQVLQLLGM